MQKVSWFTRGTFSSSPTRLPGSQCCPLPSEIDFAHWKRSHLQPIFAPHNVLPYLHIKAHYGSCVCLSICLCVFVLFGHGTDLTRTWRNGFSSARVPCSFNLFPKCSFLFLLQIQQLYRSSSTTLFVPPSFTFSFYFFCSPPPYLWKSCVLP